MVDCATIMMDTALSLSKYTNNNEHKTKRKYPKTASQRHDEDHSPRAPPHFYLLSALLETAALSQNDHGRNLKNMRKEKDVPPVMKKEKVIPSANIKISSPHCSLLMFKVSGLVSTTPQC
jgi:hypothetical protein